MRKDSNGKHFVREHFFNKTVPHSDYFRYLYPSANCREKRKSKGDTLLEEIYQDDNNVLIHFPRP